MKYEKIRSDLRIMDDVPSKDLRLKEVLLLILDILLDTMSETGYELEQFPMSDADVNSWLSICRSLISVPADGVLNGNSQQKRKDNLKKVSDSLNKMIADISEVEEYVTKIDNVEKDLQEKKSKCSGRRKAKMILSGTVYQMWLMSIILQNRKQRD